MRLSILAFVAAWLCADDGFAADAPVAAQPTQPREDTSAAPVAADALALALETLRSERSDVGIRPNGAWGRFPHPAHVPYLPLYFENTFAEPMRLYELARTMGSTAERYLTPGLFDTDPQALYRIVYYLGVDKRLKNFRDYSVNLPDLPEGAGLVDAIQAAFALAERDLEPRSFGKATGRTRAELKTQVQAMPQELQRIVGRCVFGLVDAARWQRLAMRNVPAAAVAACWAIRDLGDTQGDALEYSPQIDDVAQSLDEASLAYACMKATQAAQDARTALKEFLKAPSADSQRRIATLGFEQWTPLGWIIVRGTSDDVHRGGDRLLVVDLGGADRYEGATAASTSLATPISVCIDLAGGDTYTSDEPLAPSQGAGIFGAGVLIDVAGDDRYSAQTFAQGIGFFGLGLLADEAGMDTYTLESSGQGCGYFGIGMCLDGRDNDTYTLRRAGQGFGGVGGGIGVLADHSGRDHYIAQAQTLTSGMDAASRAQAPNAPPSNAQLSNAQGVGSGRRGDGSDGHSWAGGLGAILDLGGNDTYESGTWSLGAGFWFGTGIAFDAAGEDMYRSAYFTQGASAHYANAIFVDEAGHDQHVLYGTAGAAFAFGWSYANAIFVDKSGDDRYEARVTSFGRADFRSNALFFELDGDDRYQLGKGEIGMGAADFRDDYAEPDPIAPYNSETTSFGLFLELGGRDEYYEWNSEPGAVALSTVWGDGRIWMTPQPGSKQHGYRNHGLGMDRPDGTVPELVRFDTPSPSPTSSR